ncbi:hypothetical protein [Kitasatospora sp. NPDC092286]|uniref:hypothetical protein n=1 Tax=Kitasatospora sp. NPDC092286 TaxID=3364087 RepID=UPI0037F31811
MQQPLRSRHLLHRRPPPGPTTTSPTGEKTAGTSSGPPTRCAAAWPASWRKPPPAIRPPRSRSWRRCCPSTAPAPTWAAQEIRGKARWPDLSEDERLVARSRERLDRWDLDGGDGPGDAGGSGAGGTNASRGETPAPEPEPHVQQAPARRSAAEAAEQARREACTDPEIRFDFPDLLDDLEPTFGPGWELGSWLDPDAQGVLQLRHDSTPIGWSALLYQPPGARLLVDNLSRPKTHPTTDLALDTILRAHQARPASVR